MKLIKQTVLHFQEGKSDKVYEVDLCELGPNRYRVNFRYGRRGANLKEGTKTTGAVPLAEAEKAFKELVESKTKKGYSEVVDRTALAAASPTSALKPSAAVDAGGRKEAVLNRLLNASQSKWPLERAIWRAGELKMREAASPLVGLIGSGGHLRDYCIAWALGWCGDETAVSALGRLYGDSSKPDFVRRIACEALLKLSNEQTREEFQDDMIERLPQELRDTAFIGPAEAFSDALREYLKKDDHQRFEALDLIYLIDNENVRPALLEILKAAPLRPNYFQRLRHIFKAAEYRRDAEVFGLLAYRFEREKAMFRSSYRLDEKHRHTWDPWVQTDVGHVQNARKEIRTPSSKLAFGKRTRDYLRSRVCRTLRKLGESQDPDYVKMAVGVLLPFTDADAVDAKEARIYSWRTGQTKRVQWDAFAPYLAFNYVLYQNSRRYQLSPGTKFWRCRSPFKPGDPEPDIREEAFSKLWEQMPAGLLHLLSESNCRPVHRFAVKALRTCKEFCAALDAEAVIMLLGRPFEVTARFGFELAKERYRPENPDADLVLAVANCFAIEARAQAHKWISEGREHFLKNAGFIMGLVAGAHTDTRAFARDLLRTSVIPEASAKALMGRLVAYLLMLQSGQEEVAKDMAETILKSFGPHLRAIGMKVVMDLLAHPMCEVQELGGNILLNHDTKATALPEEILQSLIRSPFEVMRGIGVKLLAQYPDEMLLTRENLLFDLATHQLADIQESIRPVIKRLCSDAHQDFAKGFSSRLIEFLLAPESFEGAHKGASRIIKDLAGGKWVWDLGKADIFKMIRFKSGATQEAGAALLGVRANSDAIFVNAFDFIEIIELSNHEVKAVRETCWIMASKFLHRLEHAFNRNHLEEMAKAIRLLDSKWEDSRGFWFTFFGTFFSVEDFTPGILVSICDSVRKDVQKFGRDLILRFFKEEAGQEYMLKLSEHPSADMQLFVTNYLEGYATDSPERLKELAPYFTSVLSRVNKARTAKDRTLAFLASEAQKSEAAAQIAADILTRQSATIAVGDKAAAIEAMLKIRHAYSQVPLPISVKSPKPKSL